MRTTILNLDYTIISVVSWQKGMILLLKGVISPIEFWDEPIRSGSGELWQVPKIVVVKKFVKHRKEWLPTKRNIFLRDSYSCAYCGCTNPSDLTIDHVLPRSRKGKDTWENLVASCYSCNSKKANRTPEEANMPLLFEPMNPRNSLWDKKAVKWGGKS